MQNLHISSPAADYLILSFVQAGISCMITFYEKTIHCNAYINTIQYNTLDCICEKNKQYFSNRRNTMEMSRVPHHFPYELRCVNITVQWSVLWKIVYIYRRWPIDIGGNGWVEDKHLMKSIQCKNVYPIRQ